MSIYKTAKTNNVFREVRWLDSYPQIVRNVLNFLQNEIKIEK